MTNKTAIALAVLIAGLLIADMLISDGAGSLFLLKKADNFRDYIAFWR